MSEKTTLIQDVEEIRKLMRQLVEQYARLYSDITTLSDQVELQQAEKTII